MRIFFTLSLAFTILLFGHQSFSKNKNISDYNIGVENMEEAVFAAGCFWCIEKDLEKLEGVKEVISGYTGGRQEDADYKTVSSGVTKHIEAVKVYYDISKLSYDDLLKSFWVNIDPFDEKGQFCDKGYQYQAAIFYDNDEQKEKAIKSKKTIESEVLKKEVVTQIMPLKNFYKAEEYHQNYYKKNPIRYKYYRFSCGRDNRLEKIWGDIKL